jgi:hypothetical protein
MIESVLVGVVRLGSWLISSAAAIYYLAGSIVVLGGFIMFLGTIIHHFWTRAQERALLAHNVGSRHVNVHVENLNVTIQMSEEQLRAYLNTPLPRELPGGSNDPKAME